MNIFTRMIDRLNQLLARVLKPAPSSPTAPAVRPDLDGRRVRIILPFAGGFLLEKLTDPEHAERVGMVRFPGGGIHYGESIWEAVARELLEETGTTADVVDMDLICTTPHHQYGYEECYVLIHKHAAAPGVYRDLVGGRPVTIVADRPGRPNWYGPSGATLVAIMAMVKMKQDVRLDPAGVFGII